MGRRYRAAGGNLPLTRQDAIPFGVVTLQVQVRSNFDGNCDVLDD
jgi:hypothetical protein